MTDGYEPYNAIASVNELVHLGCWAHARRYFVVSDHSLTLYRRERARAKMVST
jgi:hypothetical protein